MKRLGCILLLVIATPLRAEVNVMTFEFPGETYVFPTEAMIEAKAAPTLSGELAIKATFGEAFETGFAPFTARVAGQAGILRICGREVGNIFIQTEIRGPVALLPLIDPSEAPDLAAVLNTRSCLDAPKN